MAGEGEVDERQEVVEAWRRQVLQAGRQRSAVGPAQHPHDAHHQVAARLAVERRAPALRQKIEDALVVATVSRSSGKQMRRSRNVPTFFVMFFHIQGYF